MHLPYLQILAAHFSEAHTEELATHLAAILAWSGRIHPSLRRLFFQSVISHTALTAASKDEILLAISDRVVNYLPHSASASTSPLGADQNIHSLVIALEHAMLENDARPEPIPKSSDGSILRWACSLTQRVFAAAPDHCSEDRTGDLRWNCLVLLALVRTQTAEWSGNSVKSSSDPIRRAAVMEWQTVCILAAVENLLVARHTSAADALPREVIYGFCGVLRKLWGDWTAIPPSDAPPRPPYVSRLICASFLKLAGRLEDKVLLDSCREYCVTSRLWSFQESIPASTAGLRELAMEQLYAALRCGTFFERALVDLVVCTTDMELLTAAVDTSVTRYARSDPEHAQELLAWARNRGIPPSGKAIARVGIALARHGTSSYLDRYTEHSSLSAEQRAQVVTVYLQAYVKHGRRFMEPRAVADLCPAAVGLSTLVADPTQLLRCLRSALLVLIREGYSARVVAFVEEVAAEHPSVFSEATYSRLLSAVLRHRRFKLARRLLAHSAALYPEMAPQWQDTLALRSVQGGASQLAAEVATSRASRSLRLVAKTASQVRRPGTQAVPPTLSLLALYGTTAAPAVALHAIRGLLSVGRLHAAKKLYERIARQESAEVRTAAGNMILSAIARRAERGQRVRDTAHGYRTLTEKHAFVPDRVTINILLKVLLSDKDLDAAKARALFGVVVRMGYTTGAAVQGRAEGGPGTTPAHSRPKTGSPLVLNDLEVPWPTSPIMYMRHVRPLYKTFIKTFYGLGDVDAARKVVGILRALEAQNGRWVAEGRDWVVAGGEQA